MPSDPDPQIHVTVTPNPNAMKFSVDTRLVESGSRSFSTRFEAMDDPLAGAIMEVSGVQSLFVMAGFLTVTKDPTAAWEGIVPEVSAILRRHLSQPS